jgi:pyruvate kinase
VQKHAIELARRMAKPVIVATQMLESMISSPRPTRAETSDVANAVLDGADAVMLSGETSVGEFPVVTVQTMARIIESTENHGLERIPALGTTPRTQGGAVTLAAAEVARFVDAKYLVVFTESGDSVRRMARLRPSIPLIALTPQDAIRRRMALVWGVQTYLVERVTNTDKIFILVDDVFLGHDLVQKGEKVMVVAGFPPGTSGSTNDMRVYHVGDAHSGIAPAYREAAR